MKRKSIYKQIALSLLLLVGMAGTAWGQAVTGNQYALKRHTINNVYNNNNTPVNEVTDNDDDTYFSTNTAGSFRLKLGSNDEFNVKRIVVTALGTEKNVNNRNQTKPATITVYDNNLTNPTKIQEFTGLNRTNTTFVLDLDVVLTDKWEFVLEFTPAQPTHILQINEIKVYDEIGEEAEEADIEIEHKKAKWYDWRNGGTFEDWFSDDEPMFNTAGHELIPGVGGIQASHTFIDTIYVHKGSTVNLTIPDRHNNGAVSARSYQRWYSFRTDGMFRTKNEATDAVWDLLTPTENIVMTRYKNGYVGGSLVNADIADAMTFYYPTDEQFNSWFDTSGSTGTGQAQINNNWYIVACDVSGYKDAEEGTNEFTEPTLTHRILYYIVSVDDRTGDAATEIWKNGHGRLTTEAYQEGGNTAEKKYLEEYEISYPFTRISNNTDEALALSKYAQNYAIPGVTAALDNNNLSISIEDNTAGISIVDNATTISGLNKVIQFTYPKENTTYGTRTVNDEDGDGISHATILVTKTVDGTTYNIARFKLTFRQETTLLSQTIIDNLDAGTVTAGAPWAGYAERTPSNLQEEYQLLNSINWDYDENITHDGIQKGYYPYPMAWEFSTYSFYDGSNADNFEGTAMPQWGFYAITDKYISDDLGSPSNPSGGTYHLFVDASERQGTITMLPFETKLCRGAELFVSAWVKSAGHKNEQEEDAAMLFTILGEDVAGNRIPLYRHCSGQIPHSDMLSGQISGCGSGTNEWFQVYFSFINETDVEYEQYYLEVSNFSASTAGGDMYLDDVRVYIAQPTAEVKQMESTCGNERTRLNFATDWDRLLSRTGEPDLVPEGGSYDASLTSGFPTAEDGVPYSAIGICFIDKWKYEEFLAENSGNISGAIDYAATWIGADVGTEVSENNYKYAAMFYKLDYDENVSYSEGQDIKNDGDDGALAKNNKWFFYYDDSKTGGERALTVDFYADIQPYRPYIMMVVPVDPEQNQDIATIRASLDANDFVDINNDCAIKTEVWVTSESLIRVDGEVLNPAKEYCAGQLLNFSVQLRAPNGVNDEGEQQYQNITEGVNFDWFFGSETVFNETNTTYNTSLAAALEGLRNVSPDADETTLDEVETNETFTTEMKNLIQSYLTPTGEGLHAPLVLHRPSLDVTLLQGGLDLVIRPIQVKIEIAGGDANVCWDPIPFHLMPGEGLAPELHVGFHDVTYPDGIEPGVRIGLKQIEGATSSNPIKINLRGADPVNDGATLSKQTANAFVYLTGSNDPAISAQFDEDFISESLPIGYITNLSATEDGAATNAMTIYFDREGTLTKAENNEFVFNPKEGYYYRLRIPFQEEVSTTASTQNICEGHFNFVMHVVPEYQKWIGDATDNWNNDDNWVRSKKDELKKGNDYSDYDEEHQGYVPMKFTKVTIPDSKQVELYNAGENAEASGTTHKILDLETDKVGLATTNIEYDMLVNPKLDQTTNAYICETYYTNTADQIHFEPNAEMLHAELLDYNKAWVDYKLESGKWHTLASPLQGVVAGDFYTDSETGTEDQEYFSDIYFDENDYKESNLNGYDKDNSRISPSVYQRGWKGTTNMVSTGEPNNVAVQGNWSAVYNDVEEKYEPGTGFSLKVLDMPTSTTDAIFRLPKADDKFTYYDSEGKETDKKSEDITREDAGKLSITPDANSETATDDEELFTISLTANGQSNYYLIGNPFMAHLNMKAFFETNGETNGILENKYWYVAEDGVQNIVAESDDKWVSTLDNAMIPPLRSFFVKKKEGVTSNNITFTHEMQVLGSDETSGDNTNTETLVITAKTSDGKVSRAAIAYDMAADKGYASDEDAELFLDSNLSDVPTIYTVAGTMATSINRTSELYNIPVGIYGNSTEMVTLSFEGLKNFGSATLYDAEKRTETPLREGTTLTVPASTSGRYFLRAGAPTANEQIKTSDIQIYTLSDSRVMVTSTTPLKNIRVYTINGALVRQAKSGFCNHELYLPDGIYVITAENANGQARTAKLNVN